MKFYIIIPAHNEADCIEKTLQSLVSQTLLPKKVLVVNDHSTDETSKIVEKFSAEFPFIELFNNISSSQHLPGSKIINAFYKGFQQVDENYDAICKYDADLIVYKCSSKYDADGNIIPIMAHQAVINYEPKFMDPPAPPEVPVGDKVYTEEEILKAEEAAVDIPSLIP